MIRNYHHIKAWFADGVSIFAHLRFFIRRAFACTERPLLMFIDHFMLVYKMQFSSLLLLCTFPWGPTTFRSMKAREYSYKAVLKGPVNKKGIIYSPSCWCKRFSKSIFILLWNTKREIQQNAQAALHLIKMDQSLEPGVNYPFYSPCNEIQQFIVLHSIVLYYNTIVHCVLLMVNEP